MFFPCRAGGMNPKVSDYATVTAALAELDRIQTLAESLGWGDERPLDERDPVEFSADPEWLRQIALDALQSEGDMVNNTAAQIDKGEGDATLDTLRPYMRRVAASFELLEQLDQEAA